MSVDDERIDLLVSDVDGTLVTDDKRLTEAVIAAAGQLKQAGVKLSLVSSRPPIGFAPLRRLGLDAPLGAFNGGMILDPELNVVERALVPAADAEIALAAFARFNIDAWLFTADGWFVLDAAGAYVGKERMTIQHEPRVVDSFAPLMDGIGKLVGSSKDFNAIADCEKALASELGAGTVARRSQSYYLDVTPAGFDKGVAVRRIAERLSIPISRVAVIGDMANDLPMFDVAPYRIAMGNGIDALKQKASFVTFSNGNDGFAAAVRDFVLPRAGQTGSR